MRLIYLSQGNIPSRWAHTIQTMRMAEALSPLVDDFELVIQVPAVGRRKRPDLGAWYRIRRPFRIVELPLWRCPRGREFRHHRYRAFDRAAARYAGRRRPDLVLTRSLDTAARCTRLGVPTLVENHADRSYGLFPQLVAASRSAAFVGLVTISEALAEEHEAAGIDRSRILVAPDAVDLEPFREDTPAPVARRRKALDANGARAVAVYAGHLYEHKGVGTVLAAARLMPDVLFALVGGWPEDVDRLERQSSGLPNVRITGFVEGREVPDYLLSADCLLLPNSGRHAQARWTSPLKLFEYMAARRPIVASSIPAFDGWLTNDVNCKLFRPDDAGDLARAVREVLESPAHASRLAARARADVTTWTWDRRARDVLAFARERLASPAP